MENCSLCYLELEPTQNIILSNEYCMFFQLEGAGIIVPKLHRVTAFDLSAEEWNTTYTLLHVDLE